jgi:endonuclease YncB( thermonuclease family)
MKYALFLLLMPILALAEPVGVIYDAVIKRVIDGDTVVIQANYLPKPLKPEIAVRIYGVDTPEKGFRAKCKEEDERGHAASDFTKAAVKASTKQQVSLLEWDKYGGRVLGDIILDGKSLRKMLIDQDMAREYFGDAKKTWCKQ